MTFTVETIGDATLYRGDSVDILPTLEGIDHIITDPPYSSRTHANHDDSSQRSRDGKERSELGYGSLTEDQARDWVQRFGAATDGWVVWMTDSELANPIRYAFERGGRTTFAPLPFYQSGRSMRLSGDGPCSWTDWIVVTRTKKHLRWGTLPGGYIAGAGWNDKARMGGKPVALMQALVTDYSRVADLVCDPFMGAGTTGVACLTLGRRFVGIEVDQAAFDISCRRMEEIAKQPRLFAEPQVKAVQEKLFG